MGWTTSSQSMGPAQEYLDRLHTWGEDPSYRVLASAIVGEVYYAAVECIEAGKRSVSASICLIHTDGRGGLTGYKGMDEGAGPFASAAPRHVLEALDDLPEPPVVNEWQECRNCDGTGHMKAPNAHCDCFDCAGAGRIPAKKEERDRHRWAREWRARAWAGVEASERELAA